MTYGKTARGATLSENDANKLDAIELPDNLLAIWREAS